MSKDDERKQRLAEQLRANLRRRKAQAKARDGAGNATTDKSSPVSRDAEDAGGEGPEGN